MPLTALLARFAQRQAALQTAHEPWLDPLLERLREPSPLEQLAARWRAELDADRARWRQALEAPLGSAWPG